MYRTQYTNEKYKTGGRENGAVALRVEPLVDNPSLESELQHERSGSASESEESSSEGEGSTDD